MKTAAPISRVGGHLAKQVPDFYAHSFAPLSELAEASGLLDIERTGDPPKIIMVKRKAAPATQ